uniref:BAP29/BAP31 transmembrane domain-containing protein n=1 Tax=Apteryx owenii TaxID=8824 RepID=A0A8B9Q1V4_APTOW
MSLQWTAVATFLYAEVFLVLLLCVPFVSAARWQKIFKSRLVGLAVAYGNTVFIVLIVILVLLLLDALRETRKYDVAERVSLQSSPGALEHFHMKLFRAQRNLYLAGFALLLSFLLRRLVTLISQQAVLGASTEAFRKQAEGASQAARRYMEDNDALRKVPAMLGAWGGGGEEINSQLLPVAPSCSHWPLVAPSHHPVAHSGSQWSPSGPPVVAAPRQTGTQRPRLKKRECSSRVKQMSAAVGVLGARWGDSGQKQGSPPTAHPAHQRILCKLQTCRSFRIPAGGGSYGSPQDPPSPRDTPQSPPGTPQSLSGTPRIPPGTNKNPPQESQSTPRTPQDPHKAPQDPPGAPKAPQGPPKTPRDLPGKPEHP